MPASPEQALETMIQNLKQKTGRSLEEWVALARAAKLARHKEIVDHLKARHGLGHGYANLVAQKALQPQGAAAPAGDDLVQAQYSGAKAPLRPMYDAILAAVRSFGGDVEVAPKKAYVSFRRSRQFALVQPSTATRLDVGLQLKGVAPAGRLEASGSFNAMVTHRVRVERAEQIDAELIGWLRRAYDAG